MHAWVGLHLSVDEGLHLLSVHVELRLPEPAHKSLVGKWDCQGAEVGYDALHLSVVVAQAGLPPAPAVQRLTARAVELRIAWHSDLKVLAVESWVVKHSDLKVLVRMRGQRWTSHELHLKRY